jgi:proteic killer suppression protein
MIKNFKNTETEKIFKGFKSKILPTNLHKKALIKLHMLDASENIEDLRNPPSNRLHKLQGNRKNQYSISINEKYRICFEWDDNKASNVEIIDYH